MFGRKLKIKIKHENYSKEFRAEKCFVLEHMAITKGILIKRNKRNKRADLSKLEISNEFQHQTFQRLRHVQITCPRFMHQEFHTPIIAKS